MTHSILVRYPGQVNIIGSISVAKTCKNDVMSVVQMLSRDVVK